MKRDTIKTIAGLIIIVGIVVATFLYGNAQRQKQLAHDQQVKQQQEEKAKQQANAVNPSVSPTATSSKTPAPSKSPAPTPTKTPVTAATGGTGSNGTNSTVPVTGGSGTPLPETGPESMGAVGLGAIGVMLMAVRRSRRAIVAAARAQR